MSQQIEIKEANEKSETEKYNWSKQTLMDGIHGRMKRTKERICKLQDKTIEITKYEQQRENRLLKKPVNKTQKPKGP